MHTIHRSCQKSMRCDGTYFFCLYSSRMLFSLSTDEAHAMERLRLDMLAAGDAAATRRDDNAIEIIVDVVLKRVANQLNCGCDFGMSDL